MLICATLNWESAGPAPTAAFVSPPARELFFTRPPPPSEKRLQPPIWSAYILIQLFHARAVGGSVSPPRVGLLNGNRHVMINYHYGFTLQLPRPSSPVDHDVHDALMSCRSTNESAFFFPEAARGATNPTPASPSPPECVFFFFSDPGPHGFENVT